MPIETFDAVPLTIDGMPLAEWRTHFHPTDVAARYLNIKPSTLVAWRFKRMDGPVYLKVGGRVFYLGADLIEFTERCRRTNTREPGDV